MKSKTVNLMMLVFFVGFILILNDFNSLETYTSNRAFTYPVLTELTEAHNMMLEDIEMHDELMFQSLGVVENQSNIDAGMMEIEEREALEFEELDEMNVPPFYESAP